MMARPTGVSDPSEDGDPNDRSSRSEPFGFIERMSKGTEDEREILREILDIVRTVLTITVPLVIVALAVIIVIDHLSMSMVFKWLSLAGSLVTIGGGGAVLYRRRKKAQTARKQPRNQINGPNPTADGD